MASPRRQDLHRWICKPVRGTTKPTSGCTYSLQAVKKHLINAAQARRHFELGTPGGVQIQKASSLIYLHSNASFYLMEW
jgi:hypothetical protein